ncbi:hypothetical protein [Cetobacterium sp. SF1]|uniref:hypothetical protein n=1 Tax=Cetobacterium sp. SF1 TaxID=3417654 RepID=UPI003CF48AAD
MKIKCSKKMGLSSIKTIAELEKQCIREDIANFLKTRLDSEENIDVRVKKNLLLPLGLIDNNYNLTSKGEHCVETNCVYLKEKGEYIFVELEDNIFKAIIDVITCSSLDNLSFSEKRSLKKQEIISIKDRDKKYKIFKDQEVFCEKKNVPTQVQLNYEVELDGKYNFYIEDIDYGIKEKKVQINLENINLSYKSILKILENRDNFIWNKDMEAMGITYDFGKKNNEENYTIKNVIFKKNDFEINDYNFDSITLEDIKVMPINEWEAQKWYFHRIENILKDNYIEIDEFNKQNEEELNSEFLSYYNLEKMEINEILEKLENTDEYWNLRAPLDLSFENSAEEWKKTI